MEKDKKFCGEKEPIFKQQIREWGVERGEVGNDNKNFKKKRREEFKKIELQVKRRNKRINFNYK